MKTRKVNCFSLQDTLRYGVMIIITIGVLALATVTARSNQDYPIVSKQPRGFTPRTISTARGFGKRHNDKVFQPSEMSRHDTMKLSTLKNIPQRFPIEWFVQFLEMNPSLARRMEKNVLSSKGNVRSSDTQAYKNDESDVSYYFDELE